MENPFVEDLGFDPRELSPEEVVTYLRQRSQRLVEEVASQDFFQKVLSPATDPGLVREVLKEVYLEIAMYQEHIIEASIAIIGQMPRSLKVEIIEELLHHQAEEFNHGEMAISDYVALGGSEAYARTRRASPTAFGVAALRRMMVHRRDWPAWLGSLFVVETSTPTITGMVRESFRARGVPSKALWFIDHHATADLEHSDTLGRLVQRIAHEIPESRVGLCYGPEYYLLLYPIASWKAAWNRAARRRATSERLASRSGGGST